MLWLRGERLLVYHACLSAALVDLYRLAGGAQASLSEDEVCHLREAQQGEAQFEVARHRHRTVL